MKKKTNQTPRKAKAETRIKCTNWRNMRVALTNKGRARPLNRKVLTTGIAEIQAEAILADMLRKLSAGNEVRLTCCGDAFVRFYPMLDTDLKTMYVAAQTLHPFRKAAYSGMNDFKFTTRHAAKELPKETVERRMAAKREQAALLRNARGIKREAYGVTPDVTLSCPNCGFKIRVGRKLAA